ncbi:hypothetical protein C4561_01575 [candidate division WWE3 bacterium]|jgi:hypothetical protein|uniref:Uncharacterized protein n=1 Tax=candidate division WWE3 bacterium TaxID=2053526 RepID=A0A3A4ZF56_UNCKA|nr:MAG: hypothetical protein C4561_01575 [candidate division WWE3 bacterium]
MAKTVKIQRVEGERLLPRDAVEFFKQHPEEWEKLKFGEVIEVPEEIVPNLKAVVIVEKTKKKETDTDLGGDLK